MAAGKHSSLREWFAPGKVKKAHEGRRSSMAISLLSQAASSNGGGCFKGRLQAVNASSQRLVEGATTHIGNLPARHCRQYRLGRQPAGRLRWNQQARTRSAQRGKRLSDRRRATGGMDEPDSPPVVPVVLPTQQEGRRWPDPHYLRKATGSVQQSTPVGCHYLTHSIRCIAGEIPAGKAKPLPGGRCVQAASAASAPAASRGGAV